MTGVSAMQQVREPAMRALFQLAWGAYPWRNDISTARRLRLWTKVGPEERPALFQFEGGRGTYRWTGDPAQNRVLKTQLFIYIDATDPGVVGSSQVNQILDALDSALQPKGSDLGLGRQTLGGTAYRCRIEGDPFSDPGDIDGQGLMVIPVLITLP